MLYKGTPLRSQLVCRYFAVIKTSVLSILGWKILITNTIWTVVYGDNIHSKLTENKEPLFGGDQEDLVLLTSITIDGYGFPKLSAAAPGSGRFCSIGRTQESGFNENFAPRIRVV
ncbi:unnamed protein product [Rhizophagus irregularis]|nr:unnamed protein product [Rhizophagus irregularis]